MTTPEPFRRQCSRSHGPGARNRATPPGFDGPHLHPHRHIHWHLTARLP
jgi:hypothetical protein